MSKVASYSQRKQEQIDMLTTNDGKPRICMSDDLFTVSQWHDRALEIGPTTGVHASSGYPLLRWYFEVECSTAQHATITAPLNLPRD